MSNKFADITFTSSVKEAQRRNGSRKRYEREALLDPNSGALGSQEAGFIAARDSFYMATVSETGWPYVQHRGGPPGFVKVFDPETIAFPDFRGNRQYVSLGNITSDDRVSMFFMDYPNRARLKVLGRARVVGADEKDSLERLQRPEYRAVTERAFLVTIEAFDWNCRLHITPRFTPSEIEAVVAPLHQRIAELERQLKERS